ncbi:MAG: DUF6164 family protein [Pseudomonadota bacterium]|nr:hypothetical protein [Gammaproteobacteria bacterium]MBU1731568.1 hypothetical protein [Gammaproteobacteria bacterium]MBU1893728.1 hypothetical protein [Gammaproteobacteria bacterium]
MAVKLFPLNGVPDDEAEDVRALLKANGVEFSETSAGNWGIFSAAIWLPDDSRLDEAKALIAGYQSERQTQARAEYEALCREGKQRTLIDVIQENPLRFFAYAAVIAAILYFSIKPFLDLGK